MFAKNKKYIFLIFSLLSSGSVFSQVSPEVPGQILQPTVAPVVVDVTPPTIGLLSKLQQMEIETGANLRLETLNPPPKVLPKPISLDLVVPKPIVIPVNKSKKILAIFGRLNKPSAEMLMPNGFVITVSKGFKSKEFEVLDITEDNVIIKNEPKIEKTKTKTKNNNKNEQLLIFKLRPGDTFI